VILSVAEGGTLALTQQLTHFNALGSVIPIGAPFNPFAAQNVGRPQHLHQVCPFLWFTTFTLFLCD
jgi:glutathione peroxidase-family protein